MRDHEKRQTLRRLWMERPLDQRTARDLIVFHEFVSENFPALLKGVRRNTLDQLREDIGELCAQTAR
jgi:hypothetical protein